MTDKKREELVEARRKAYAELDKAADERAKARVELRKAIAELGKAGAALEAYDNDR